MGFRDAKQLIERFRNTIIADNGDTDVVGFDDCADALVLIWEQEVGYDDEASPLASETAFCAPIAKEESCQQS